MKLKDFFTKLKTDGKITQAEFLAAIETLPEFEFPDKAVEAFESSFLTIDRATTHKDVHSKLIKEFVHPFDNDFKKILTVIDGVDKFKASEIDKMQSTYDKSAAITAFLPELVAKLKVAPSDEDSKKKLKEKEEAVTELMQRIEKMNKEYSEKEKFFETEADKKINGFRLNMELEKLANNLKFGKAYSDEAIRKDITKGKLDSIRNSNSLSLIEKDGQADIQVLDKEGKPRFNGNSAVTINQLMEEAFKPYIKANNSGDDEGEEEQPQTKRFKVQDVKTEVRQGRRTTVQ